MYKPKFTDDTYSKFGYSPRYATGDQMRARRQHGYRGLGDYERGPLGGRFIPFMRKLPWAKIGKVGLAAARAGLGAYRGLGDYEGGTAGEAAPVTTYGPAVDNQLISGGNAPISVNASDDLTGDITFSHTEFVTNIVATTTGFQNRSFAINPGLNGTFPFLSQLARNFTLYDLEGLIFEYRPTSGEMGVSSNALGKVIMATNYDPDSPAFTTSRIMENYDYAVASKPSLTARHGVETANGQQALDMMYIRQGDQTRDKIFTDLGTFQIATEGLPQTGQVGELWVTYTCRLSRSKINTEGVTNAYFQFTSVGANSVFNQHETLQDSIGLTFNSDDQTITFPQSAKGKAYLLRYTIRYGESTSIITLTNQPTPTWSSTGAPAPIRWVPEVDFFGTGLVPAHWASELTTTVPTANKNGPVYWTTQKGVLFNDPNAVNPTLTLSIAQISSSQISNATLHITELNADFAQQVNDEGIIDNAGF